VKLLFDHHLSPTLVDRVADLFPGSEHVWNVQLHSVSDETVWLYAREHDFTVVSKDADFSEISMQLGYPPKLIWLQIKNWSTDQVEQLLRSRYTRIVELPAATDRAILVLFGKSADPRML
jgi:predicted nuclease of predicted toxin-antitoxin system